MRRRDLTVFAGLSFTMIAGLLAWGQEGKSAAPPAERSDAQAEQEIRRRYDEEHANLERRDVAAQDRFLPDDFVVTNAFGMFIDKRQVMERLRADIIKYEKYERAYDAFRRYGDTMVVVGSETVVPTADAKRPDAGSTVKRRFTEVWVRRDGAWEKVVRHGSNAPQAAADAPDRARDEAAIKQLGNKWEEAWNARDADALADLLDDDADFITVRGPEGWLKGRAQLKEDHAQKLRTRFAKSRWTTKEVHVKFIRPDLAFARVLWATTGDEVRHVKHGEPREGIFTWVVERKGGTWRVIGSQNTESMPVLPGQ